MAVAATAEATNGAPEVHVHWSPGAGAALVGVEVQRSDAGGPWHTVATGVGGTDHVDTAVTDGSTYRYRIIPTADAGHGPRRGAGRTTDEVTAAADPYAPYGSVLINSGEPETTTPEVTLQLSAEDVGGTTPVDRLEMRLSTDPAFAGAAWEPFAAEVPWKLSVAPGEQERVYVEFRDEAGNVSGAGELRRHHLPAVTR